MPAERAISCPAGAGGPAGSLEGMAGVDAEAVVGPSPVRWRRMVSAGGSGGWLGVLGGCRSAFGRKVPAGRDLSLLAAGRAGLGHRAGPRGRAGRSRRGRAWGDDDGGRTAGNAAPRTSPRRRTCTGAPARRTAPRRGGGRPRGDEFAGRIAHRAAEDDLRDAPHGNGFARHRGRGRARGPARQRGDGSGRPAQCPAGRSAAGQITDAVIPAAPDRRAELKPPTARESACASPTGPVAGVRRTEDAGPAAASDPTPSPAPAVPTDPFAPPEPPEPGPTDDDGWPALQESSMRPGEGCHHNGGRIGRSPRPARSARDRPAADAHGAVDRHLRKSAMPRPRRCPAARVADAAAAPGVPSG